MNERFCIENGDCLEVLRQMPDDFVDAVVTDPPAGIGFMGKAWDRMKADGLTELQAFQEFIYEVFKEVYRVLKPGGHAVVWALPRTSHHTAMGLERAGFDIRDNGTYLFHLFGSGFPKSLDVSKAIDKAAGAEREVLGQRIVRGVESGHTNKSGGSLVGRTITDKVSAVTAPATDAAKAWEGWGTALKPAVEFWIVARKPLDGTVAENVLAHGTGALNIDGCRVGFQSDDDKAAAKPQGRATAKVGALAGGTQNEAERTEFVVNQSTAGRWPAHLILDEGAAALLDEQSGTRASGKPGTRRKAHETTSMVGRLGITGEQEVGYGDSGGASRFFYVPKTSKRDKDEGLDDLPTRSPGEKTDREDGSAGITAYSGSRGVSRNSHPTVKSTALMAWLVRLVTPPGGIVLDPFMGSGSTGKAALLEGFRFIGIERESEYFAIAERRLLHACRKVG